MRRRMIITLGTDEADALACGACPFRLRLEHASTAKVLREYCANPAWELPTLIDGTRHPQCFAAEREAAKLVAVTHIFTHWAESANPDPQAIYHAMQRIGSVLGVPF